MALVTFSSALSPPRASASCRRRRRRRGVHHAEHAVGFAVGRRNLQRDLRGRHRLLHLALPQVQARELGGNVGRDRIQLHRALVRRDRPGLVVALVEMTREQKLAVCFPQRLGRGGATRGRVARRGRACRKRRTDDTLNAAMRAASFMPRIVPQKPEGVIYSQHARRPRIARDSCLSQLQDAGDARQERRRAQVRHVQARVPDQGRHSGHAHRRSDHRRLKSESRILLVRLRQIGDVVFTTPAVHALRRRFPDAHLTYIVEPAAAPVVVHNPHLDEVIVAPRARAASADCSRICCSAGVCAPVVTTSPSTFTAGRGRRC